MAVSTDVLTNSDPRRLETVPRLAANLGCARSTVHDHVSGAGIPRRGPDGKAKQNGSFIYVRDYIIREDVQDGLLAYTTDEQCQNDLRRAGLLPPIKQRP